MSYLCLFCFSEGSFSFWFGIFRFSFWHWCSMLFLRRLEVSQEDPGVATFFLVCCVTTASHLPSWAMGRDLDGPSHCLQFQDLCVSDSAGWCRENWTEKLELKSEPFPHLLWPWVAQLPLWTPVILSIITGKWAVVASAPCSNLLWSEILSHQIDGRLLQHWTRNHGF